MKRKKLFLNLCLFSILFFIFSTSFIYFVFATKYDEDLSNLSSTNSVTLKIGDSDYTVKSDTDIDGLINLDAGILEYKAKDGTIDYTKIYNQLLEIMKKNVTEIDSDINEQTISESTIWKIDGSVNMNGNVTISSTGNLIIIGNGTIKRTGSYSILNNGNLFLQDNVIADGMGEQYNSRFISSSGDNSLNAKLYLADNFKICNFVISNQFGGAGIYGKYTIFYMTGGIIGDTDITIKWDDGISTIYGEETENYLKLRESKNEYPHMLSITSNNGCVGIDNGGGAPWGAGVFLTQSTFYMSDGKIIGNSLIGARTVDVHGDGSHGAGCSFIDTNVFIKGGLISANQSNIASGASTTYNQYSGAIQLMLSDGNSEKYVCEIENAEISYNYSQRWVGGIDVQRGYTLHLKKNAVFKYNKAEDNCGAIAVDGSAAKMHMEDGSIITRNYSGHLGAGVRCLGELIMDGGEISYNKSIGNAAGLSIQTDYLRTGNAILNGGEIKYNYSLSSGGGIGIVVDKKKGTGGLTLNGTKIYYNVAKNFGGGFFMEAANGLVNAILNSGSIMNNSAGYGGGIYVLQENSCSAVLNISSEKFKVQENAAEADGGGIYLYHQMESSGSISADINNGIINSNISGQDGGGLYLNSGNLSINSGNIKSNVAQRNGGGIYVLDGVININGGFIEKNISNENGGGIYSNANINMNNGNVQYNTSYNGNGSGIYLSNDSKFSFLNGKVAYNTASCSTSISNMTAKKSTCGVGGGVYIEKGTFSMYDESNNAGTGAIYGNIASYAADDLFATGKNTKFDAISVIEMKKSDEYMTSDSWFEDFPEGEEHMSLNKDNRVNLISKGRYKKLSNDELVDDMIAATTVLNRDCTDYIAITMGKGIGDLSLQVKDTNVQSDQIFLYKLEYVKANDNDNGDLSMIISVDSSKSSIIRKLPSGRYKLTLIPEWSWRYENKVSANIMVNNSISKTENNSFEFNIYSNQMTKCETSYFLKKNSNVFTKFFSIIAGDS